MPKVNPKNAFSLVPAMEGNRMVGLALNGIIPFDAFSDEREGNEYEVWINAATGKVVSNPTDEQKDSGEVIRDARKASEHRDLRKNFSNAEIIWPDGKVRDISFRLKANNPLTPEEYAEAVQASTTKRAATTIKNLDKAGKQALMAQLAAELEADEDQ